MQKILIASALLLASVGAAGIASAADDCAPSVPGFYNSVCLFDDHTTAGGYAYCDFISCYSVSYSTYTNRFAAGGASLPFAGGASAAAQQGTNSYSQTSCSIFWGCSSYSSYTESTNIGGGAGTPLAGASAGLNQGKTTGNSNGWPFSYYNTNLGAGAGIPFFGVSTGFYQNGGVGYCYQGVYFYTSFGGLPIPSGPCSVSTPLGTASTVIPQLYSTCQPTPAGTVCGRLPDMPDGTGLPFL